MEIFLEVAINNLENQSVEAQLLDPNEDIKEDDSEISKTFKKIYLKLSKQDFNLFLQINLFNHMNVIAKKFVSELASDLQIEYSKENYHELIDKWAFEKTTHLPFYYDMKKFDPYN